jgi:hypothetical protein
MLALVNKLPAHPRRTTKALSKLLAPLHMYVFTIQKLTPLCGTGIKVEETS